MEICDSTGNNCFVKEARVDAEWNSEKLVTTKSKSILSGQSDREVFSAYSCRELGRLGACKDRFGDSIYSIRKIQRL